MIQPTEVLHRALHRPRNRLRMGEVASHGQNAFMRCRCSQLRLCRPQRGFIAPRQDNPRAFRQQRRGNRPADAPRAPRNKRNLLPKL